MNSNSYLPARKLISKAALLAEQALAEEERPDKETPSKAIKAPTKQPETTKTAKLLSQSKSQTVTPAKAKTPAQKKDKPKAKTKEKPRARTRARPRAKTRAPEPVVSPASLKKLIDLLQKGLVSAGAKPRELQLDFIHDTCIVRIELSNRVWQKIGEGDWGPIYVDELVERKLVKVVIKSRMGINLKPLPRLLETN